MSAKTKKRKLPADLYEAEALLRTTSSARRAVMEACKSLQAVELNEVEGVPQAQALSPDALTTWLVAKYGIQEVQKMAKILVNLPETLTPSQKSRYFKQLSGTQLKMGCYITPLGHYTILVIKNIKGKF